MNSRKIAIDKVMKYGLLCIIVFALYILQGTPGFLQIFGVKPVFLIPFCINLAMLEEEQYVLIVYVLAGLLFEMSAGRLVGMYTIPLLVACMICLVMVKYVLQPSYRNSAIMSGTFLFLILTIDFFFSYFLPGHDGILIIYLKTVVLTTIYSTLFSVLYYKIIVLIQGRFRKYNAR